MNSFDTAVLAYRESCDLGHINFQQPIEEFSRQIDDVIYLRVSATGYVARYDVRRRRLLA
jgi:tRNA splicing ligase